MNYISSRGRAPQLGFQETLLAGLAGDGGLYLPTSWPQLSQAQIAAFAEKTYEEVAFEVLSPFVGDEIAPEILKKLIARAYSGFADTQIAPLRHLESQHHLLELFHGPTLAFKDVAMQLLALLMDHALAGNNERATIVGATSGDTGGAAIEAFRGTEATDIFILYPHGRVSDVQRKQMTTAYEANVHAVAINGTFDDCQALVKSMFNDQPFRERVRLAGVNSINWVRVMAQTVYYFTAAVALGAPEREISFSVPTGNFGDIFAGYVAKQMGLPIKQLMIATNVNDILARTLATGVYETDTVIATSSPSMDIQISSNFERLLFEVTGRDGARVQQYMDALQTTGKFMLDEDHLATIRALFVAARVDQAETDAVMQDAQKRLGLILDPHTAVGLGAARKLTADDVTPIVTLATAHPAKFPASVEAACKVHPTPPPHVAELLKRPEKSDFLANDLATVEAYIEAHARITAKG